MVMNYLRLWRACLFANSVLGNCYVLALGLGLIVVIFVMISDVFVPKLGSSRPIIVNAIKPVNNVADNRSLSFIFERSSDRNEKLFANVCGSCHAIAKDAFHKVGPNLWDIAFSKIASAANFRYSSSLMKLSTYQWNLRALNRFIENPIKYVPGTNMSFSGLVDPFERMQILRHLITKANNPLDITTLKYKP
ncbi:MAG: c-type cytochrome [Candidatus Hodgkinia cicadicola]